MTILQKIEEAKQYIQSKHGATPRIGLVLGSGLGVLGEEVEAPTHVPFSEIPNFPVSTVEGHAGRLVLGQLAGQEVIVMQGRFHFYEGWSLDEVTFPVRVMKALGVEILIVTNAAGGIDPEWNAGDLMLIADHINFTGQNPLIGPNEAEIGARFPDMSNAYNRELRATSEASGSRPRHLVARGCICRRFWPILTKHQPRFACCGSWAVTRSGCRRCQK